MKRLLKSDAVLVLGLSLTLLFFSCKETKTAPPTLSDKEEIPEKSRGQVLLEACIQAHGGLEKWKSFQGLEYVINDNGKEVYQLTHLKDRRAYLKSKKYEVGFNGKVAWSIPNAEEVSGKSAAFYYNLDFYFLGIPFLLTDPGVNVDHAGTVVINEKEYESLKVTFGSKVGYTPEDIYYLYIDSETNLLGILTYSISYFDKENASVNTAKVYSDYRKVQGLLMPHKMENFEWKNGTLGNSKNHLRLFSDIIFLEKIENTQVFEVPSGAVVEEL